jgi:hypothetical protein
MLKKYPPQVSMHASTSPIMGMYPFIDAEAVTDSLDRHPQFAGEVPLLANWSYIHNAFSCPHR